MHREIMQTPMELQTDHINGNKLDNRKENLRICTCSENQHNKKIYKNNLSGYKGVYFDKANNCWRALIRINGKKIYLGTFYASKDAAKAYDIAAKKYFGEFAVFNFV